MDAVSTVNSADWLHRLPLLLPNGKNGPVDDLTSGPHSPDIELVWSPIIYAKGELMPVPMNAHGITVASVLFAY